MSTPNADEEAKSIFENFVLDAIVAIKEAAGGLVSKINVARNGIVIYITGEARGAYAAQVAQAAVCNVWRDCFYDNQCLTPPLPTIINSLALTGP